MTDCSVTPDCRIGRHFTCKAPAFTDGVCGCTCHNGAHTPGHPNWWNRKSGSPLDTDRGRCAEGE